MLAARWQHRESIDLDLVVNAGTAMPALFAGPANDLETQLVQRGGSSVTIDRDRCTVRFSTGKLDLSALDRTPSAGHAEALVDGAAAVVLSNAQRSSAGSSSAPRAAPCVTSSTSWRLDPRALAIAANTRTACEVEARPRASTRRSRPAD